MAGICAIYHELEILVPESARTLAGFRAWAKSDEFPERGRISFIEREVLIDMSPEELETHNKVKTEIDRVIANLNRQLELGELYSDRTLVTNIEAGLSTEPDSSFVTWASFEQGRVRLVPREGEEGQYLEIEGTPDWMLEIVSASSVRKDTQLLREAYHRARIPEYWLIDARGEEIIFKILLWRRTGYAAAICRDGWQRSRVFGRQFRLERRRGRMGLWQYTLEVKK